MISIKSSFIQKYYYTIHEYQLYYLKISLLSFLACHCSYFHISLKIKTRMCLSDKTIVLQIMSYYMPRLCHLTTIKRFKYLFFQHAKFDFDVYISPRVTLTNSLACKEWQLLLYSASENIFMRLMIVFGKPDKQI